MFDSDTALGSTRNDFKCAALHRCGIAGTCRKPRASRQRKRSRLPCTWPTSFLETPPLRPELVPGISGEAAVPRRCPVVIRPQGSVPQISGLHLHQHVRRKPGILTSRISLPLPLLTTACNATRHDKLNQQFPHAGRFLRRPLRRREPANRSQDIGIQHADVFSPEVERARLDCGLILRLRSFWRMGVGVRGTGSLQRGIASGAY